MSPGKWRSFCLSLNVLRIQCIISVIVLYAVWVIADQYTNMSSPWSSWWYRKLSRISILSIHWGIPIIESHSTMTVITPQQKYSCTDHSREKHTCHSKAYMLKDSDQESLHAIRQLQDKLTCHKTTTKPGGCLMACKLSVRGESVVVTLGMTVPITAGASSRDIDPGSINLYKTSPGIILGMAPANERRHYIATPSLIGWSHTQSDPWSQLSAGPWSLELTQYIPPTLAKLRHKRYSPSS